MDPLDQLLLGSDSREFSVIGNSVLLVEDGEVARKMIREMLIGIGIKNVLEAGSAHEAFGILQSENVSVALLDIELGEISGVQLLRGIRSIETLRSMPVIMMTASRKHRHLSDAKYLGAIGYLLKPFKSDQLIATLRAAVRIIEANDTISKSDKTGTGRGKIIYSWSGRK